MSFRSGSFSLTRYRVLGREERLAIADLNKKFGSYQAKALNLQSSVKELASGWVLPDNPELEKHRNESWDISDCLYEDGILLRMRIERRSVPVQLLQEVAHQRWQDSRKDEGGPEPQRVLKKQIMDEVKEELLRMSLPHLSYIDAFWKDQDDVVYLFSQGKMARECFEELFRKSFSEHHGLSLIRILPPLMGLENGAWADLDGQKELFDKLRQTLPGVSTQPVIS